MLETTVIAPAPLCFLDIAVGKKAVPVAGRGKIA
jgi:hypothetical protein